MQIISETFRWCFKTASFFRQRLDKFHPQSHQLCMKRSFCRATKGKMADDRMRVVLRHLSTPSAPAMQAIGVTNPIKAIGYNSNYSEARKPYKNSRKYTSGCGKLTSEQRSFYEKNGYIVIPKLVSLEDLRKYERRFQDICDNIVNIPGLTVMKEKSFVSEYSSENVIYKLQDLFYDEVLFDYCKLPQILDFAENFCGPNIKAIHTMLINKPPDSGSMSSRHPLHQDLHYFPFRPAEKIVCAWTAMERISRENGCLVVIPGTHTGKLLDHAYPEWEGGVNKLTHGITVIDEYPPDERVYLEMNPGDTVLFHPLLIHGSGRNRTTGFRKAISCHYAASECYYIDVQGTSQQFMADELLDLAKKKGAELDDITVIWRYRSQLVRGKEGNL